MVRTSSPNVWKGLKMIRAKLLIALTTPLLAVSVATARAGDGECTGHEGDCAKSACSSENTADENQECCGECQTACTETQCESEVSLTATTSDCCSEGGCCDKDESCAEGECCDTDECCAEATSCDTDKCCAEGACCDDGRYAVAAQTDACGGGRFASSVAVASDCATKCNKSKCTTSKCATSKCTTSKCTEVVACGTKRCGGGACDLQTVATDACKEDACALANCSQDVIAKLSRDGFTGLFRIVKEKSECDVDGRCRYPVDADLGHAVVKGLKAIHERLLETSEEKAYLEARLEAQMEQTEYQRQVAELMLDKQTEIAQLHAQLELAAEREEMHRQIAEATIGNARLKASV
ncbi:MAG: hypothetical protein AAF961_06300, partial [Planctomycetota bacterium]